MNALSPGRENEIREAAGAFSEHPKLGFACCSAHDAADAVPELLAEIDRLRTHVSELETQRERRRGRLIALQNDALDMRGSLSPNGEARKVPFPLGETLTPAIDWLINRVSELEGDLNAGVNAAIRNAMEGSAVRRARSEALAEAADKLVLELTPESQAAGHGFLHALRHATQSLRRMSDEAATQ
ncbi:hypothetical protein [Streptomyces sp. NPDC059802]|uniref:hypothetical protein n=1 Tax=Streptomyces sp. NPDC059802 TaxID=3346952 RepID=UPI0036628037